MINEIHYTDWECYGQGFTKGVSSCGVVVPIEEGEFLTRNKKKVTCGNCKRTNLFKERRK